MAKATLLGVAQTALVAIPIYALAVAGPGLVVAVGGAGPGALRGGLANLAPVLIVPLFYTPAPAPRGGLAGAPGGSGAQSGAAVRGVFVMDMSRRMSANAP